MKLLEGMRHDYSCILFLCYQLCRLQYVVPVAHYLLCYIYMYMYICIFLHVYMHVYSPVCLVHPTLCLCVYMYVSECTVYIQALCVLCSFLFLLSYDSCLLSCLLSGIPNRAKIGRHLSVSFRAGSAFHV